MNYQEIFNKLEEKGLRVDSISKLREALKETNINKIISDIDAASERIDKSAGIIEENKSALEVIDSVRELLNSDEVKNANNKKDIEDLEAVFSSLEYLLFGSELIEREKNSIMGLDAQIAEKQDEKVRITSEIETINSKLSEIDDNKSLSRDEKHASFKELLIKLEENTRALEETTKDIKGLRSQKGKISKEINKYQGRINDELARKDDFGAFFKYEDSFGDAMQKLSLSEDIKDKLNSEFKKIRTIYRRRKSDTPVLGTDESQISLDDLLAKYGLVKGEQIVMVEANEPVVEEPIKEEKQEVSSKYTPGQKVVFLGIDGFGVKHGQEYEIESINNGEIALKGVNGTYNEEVLGIPVEVKKEEEHTEGDSLEEILRIFTHDEKEAEKKPEVSEPQKEEELSEEDAFNQIFKIFNHEPNPDVKSGSNIPNNSAGVDVSANPETNDIVEEQKETTNEEPIVEPVTDQLNMSEVRLNPKRKKVVNVHPVIKAKAWTSFGLQTAAILGIVTFGTPAILTAAALTAVSMVLNTDAASDLFLNIYKKGIESGKTTESVSVVDKLKNRFNSVLTKAKEKISSVGGPVDEVEAEIVNFHELGDKDLENFVEDVHSRIM